MLKKHFLLLSGVLLLQPFGSYAQNDFCSIQNTSFNEGERLVFRVFYNMSFVWVPAGEAVFTVTKESYNNRPAYHIVGAGKTLKSYEWFYKVDDRYESYVDMQTLLPLRFIRNVSEGGYKFSEDISFSHETFKASSKKGTKSIGKCTQDVLSAIYYARNIDYSKYKAGDKIPFSMFLDNELYQLYIRYLGKEKITTKYGTYNTIKISPLLIEGTLFSGGEKMAVWVTDDANHLPVRIDSPIIVGSVKVDLQSYANLRSPMAALVKKK